MRTIKQKKQIHFRMIHRSVAHPKVGKQSHPQVAHHSVVHNCVEGIFPEMTHLSVIYL